MQMVVLMSRPGLECWRITRHACEVAVMQPIQNLLFLTHSRKPHIKLVVRAVPCRSLRSVLVRLAVVSLLPTRSDKQHVSDLDITTLRRGPDIDPLVLSALVQLFPRNWVVVVGIVIDALLVGITSVVEQHAAPRDSMFSPVVDGALVVCSWSGDVRAFGSVVERTCWDVRKVPEAVPLRAGLCVHVVEVIICDSVDQRLDLMLEDFATKSGLVGYVEGKVDRHNFTGPDFFCRGSYAGWCEKVQSADLFIVSMYYLKSS